MRQIVSNGTTDAANPFPYGPPPVSAAEAAAISRSIEAAERELAPADHKMRIAHVGQLFHHFWMPDLPPSAWKAIYADWAEVLAEYPGSIIREACLRWLRNYKHRPSPAAIRELCDDALMRERRKVNIMCEIVGTYHADPTWRWREGDPEPPPVAELQAQRTRVDIRNMHETWDAPKRFHPYRMTYSADEAAEYCRQRIEVRQFVGWQQSVDDAKERATQILHEAAKRNGIALDDIDSGSTSANREGISVAYAIGGIAGWLRDEDETA